MATEYDNARAEAAKWMFDREEKFDDERVHYWHHNVFTKHNQAPDCLRHNPMRALTIFGDLVQRGLLVPHDEINGVTVYRINHGQDPQWQEIMHPHLNVFGAFGWKLADWIGGWLIGVILTSIVAWALCSSANQK